MVTCVKFYALMSLSVKMGVRIVPISLATERINELIHVKALMSELNKHNKDGRDC